MNQMNQIASRHLLLILRCSFDFFTRQLKHRHLTFSVAVRLSLSRILRQVKWWSVSMVTRYDVISSRWSKHFWVKIHFFSTFFDNKSRNSWIKWYKVLLYVLFYISTKTLPFIWILTRFLILCKIQDGYHYWWRHWPPATPPPVKYTSSC